MTQWQYLVRVFQYDRDAEEVVEYVTREYSEETWKEMLEYDPLTLEAWLNKYGEEGWELVKIEGINAVGKKGDLGMVYPPSLPNWIHHYLCVFKRRKAE